MVLPFQYAAERSSTGMTAMAGAGVYLDMMAAAGLWAVGRHVGFKGMHRQGWTDTQYVVGTVERRGRGIGVRSERARVWGVCCAGWRLMGCAVASVGARCTIGIGGVQISSGSMTDTAGLRVCAGSGWRYSCLCTATHPAHSNASGCDAGRDAKQQAQLLQLAYQPRGDDLLAMRLA